MKLINEEIIKKLTLEEKASLMSGHDFWQTQKISRLGINSIFLADGPHGIRKQAGSADHLGLNESIKATCFPTASAMANTFNLDLALEMSSALGLEAKSQNVNILLGPGMNIKRNPRCGRNFEYFSEDPYLSGKMAASYVKGIQSNNVSACIKHFAANNQETRRMVYDSIIDERALREIYLTGFEIAIKESNPLSLMTSYNKLNGYYTNENSHLLVDILRNEWGYKNLIVTDWGGCNSRVEGIKCGNALEMPTNNGETDLDIVNAVKSGNLNESVLDQRVDELLSIINKTEINEQVSFDQKQHHEIAKRCALESIVLLKNENKLLPLSKENKIAFIGDFFKNSRYQGAGSSVVNPTMLDNVIDLIPNYDINYNGFAKGYNRYGKKNERLAKQALKLAKQSDIIVYAMGLDEVTEAEGMDRESINISQNQIDLLTQLKELNKKVVVVLFSGSIIDLSFDKYADSLVHSYLFGQAGASALLDILTGKVSPSGRLAESYPMSYDDVSSSESFPETGMTVLYKESIYVGYRYLNLNTNKIKYPFGYGLSYTDFSYSDLKVYDDHVTFKVKNNGDVASYEVSQLYINKKNSSILRTAPELKGFNKVWLEPNEEKEINIYFDEYTFRYFNTNTNKFEIEPGEYEVLIGKNSLNYELTGNISLEGTNADLSDLNTYEYKKDNSDDYFERFIGRKLPNKELPFYKKKRIVVDYNTTVLDLRYAKGWTGRFFSGAIRFAVKLLRFFGNKTLANTLIMGMYNNPMRGLSRMSGGMISYAQLDGLITMFNGKFFKGLGMFLKAKKNFKKVGDKMDNKESLKQQKKEEKLKLKSMSKEEKKAYLDNKKIKKNQLAIENFKKWEEEHELKVKAKEKQLEEKNKSKIWFNLGQSKFCQWFVRGWNKFKCKSPSLAKLVYQVAFFFIFSNGVTIWQYLVMLFLPNLFGEKMASIEFVWPQVTLWTWSDGTPMIFGIFNEPVKYLDGVVQIGGGLGNFIAFEIAVFTAQCINFPLQRNITFKSDGNPVVQAIWYFIGWVLISILVNAVWGFVGPVFSHLITSEKAITDLLKTFITGGLSMVVFFFIFKIIFPEKKEDK